jgi:hypothetical protein
VQNGLVVYDIGAVLGGEQAAVQMLATMVDPLPAGRHTVSASAVISTATSGEPPDGNQALDVDEVATRPDLAVDVGYQDVMPWPSKRVTYTLHYGNLGHIATTGAVITASPGDHAAFDPDASDPDWRPVTDGRFHLLVGDLDFNAGGELAFVVTLTDTYFTGVVTDFDARFEIADDGGSGDDSQPGNNVFDAPLGVPNLVIEDVAVDPWVWSGQQGFLLITVRNRGTGVACGVHRPDLGCAAFSLDPFLNPAVPPDSYPNEAFGDCFVFVNPILPGHSDTAAIFFTHDPILPGAVSGYCLASVLNEIWLKVDNWDPEAAPFPEVYGLVPESNEYDNVYGPVVQGYNIYLPMVLRGH